MRVCKQKLRDRAKERILSNERKLVTVGHYAKWTGAVKSAVLKLSTCDFEVAAEYNRLCVNSKLLGRKLGERERDFGRDPCFWCMETLNHTEHYLWGCASPTVMDLREKLLMPSDAAEMAAFLQLKGTSSEEKLRKYKAGILRHRPEKVLPYIQARQAAEEKRRVLLRGWMEHDEFGEEGRVGGEDSNGP